MQPALIALAQALEQTIKEDGETALALRAVGLQQFRGNVILQKFVDRSGSRQSDWQVWVSAETAERLCDYLLQMLVIFEFHLGAELTICPKCSHSEEGLGVL